MSGQRGHELQLEAITQRFHDFVAVRDINLRIGAGELVALLGPSGCGKSTLLRIISGFMRQTEGRVLFDGEPVDHLSPSRRGVGIVFQNYALFPHLSIRQNIAYGLEVQGVAKAKRDARVDEMLALVHMSEFAGRFPRQLSGGQQQRVALARCLAADPKILLLDEPFGALDKNLRLDMQIEVKRLQREYGITTVLVTHDQEEALSMADRVAVMSRGRVEQIASPTDIYDRPATLFVNQFVGSTNVLDGTVSTADADGSPVVALAGGRRIRVASDAPLTAGSAVRVSIRPEHLHLHAEAPGADALPGAVQTALPLGALVVYDLALEGGAALKVSVPRQRGEALLPAGAQVWAAPQPSAGYRAFPA